MILTITMNPSIDISYSLDNFNVNTVNRVNKTVKTAGGKGLNVTRVLQQLDNDVIASGLIGGELGKNIQRKLDSLGIKNSFYEISQETRNCIAILHEGKQTEILEEGPTITKDEMEGFLKHFEELLKKVNIVSISGSIPKGVEENFYIKLLELCHKNNKAVVLDCSGNALKSVLKSDYNPKVIKPNTEELSQLIGKKISKNTAELKKVLSEKLFEKVEWVVVSLGADGAVARHNNKFYKVNIPKIEAINPVGSGDSTIAGIVSALIGNYSDKDLLKKAATLGTLNAMEKQTGYVNMDKYNEIYKKIDVEEI